MWIIFEPNRYIIFLLIIRGVAGISFNQPRFCPNASWNPIATTLATVSMIGPSPYAFFVDTNNTVYAARFDTGQIIIWFNGSNTFTMTIQANLSGPWRMFVTSNDEILVDNGCPSSQVYRWTLNGTRLPSPISTYSPCSGLFVDINNDLYCSQQDRNQVISKPLNGPPSIYTVVAGTGCPGSSSDMLNSPEGIFVTDSLDLYVADCNNNRVQLFQFGQRNGTTVAGNGASGTISLSCPAGITLDGDGYPFITDGGNQRIIGSGLYGFYCVVGCFGVSGSSAMQLNTPTAFAFDNIGNIFVLDTSNSRIQKFTLLTPLSNTTQLTTAMTTINTTAATPPSATLPNPRSFNQPRFCPNASWTWYATAFATSSTIGNSPYALFVNTHNTVYAARFDTGQIIVWFNGSTVPTTTIQANLSGPWNMFVTSNDEILVDNGCPSSQVDRWTLNGTRLPSPMFTYSQCAGLFVDINNDLYCSQQDHNQVISKPLNGPPNTYTAIAGTGCAGSSSDMLNSPEEIFVTDSLDLYVADCNNNRVQLFRYGQRNATTVAGNGAPGTITLYRPSAIAFDGDGYLYIGDCGHNRIIGSGPYGFYCVIGCAGGGSSPGQLNGWIFFAFDNIGNIFVLDSGNNRIQKFILIDHQCGQTTVLPTSTQVRPEPPTSTEQPSTALLMTSSMTLRNQSCFPPTVTLIPDTSTFSVPLQVRRYQDFYLSSIIELNCNNSLTTNVQWTIKNCSSTCLNSISVNSSIITSFSELYIPARSLPMGLYEMKLTVSMNTSSGLSSSASAYVQITPSGITANLVQLGTSMITSGYQQDLQLNPGLYSVDLDADEFNASNWDYTYYCRVYGQSLFPNKQGFPLSIDDDYLDPLNRSCFTNQSAWQYDGVQLSSKSSLTLLADALRSNRTYQFMVYMQSKRNSTLQATGFLLVLVDETFPQMIAVGCVITTMCVPNLEFQLVNPTTQVALFALCVGSCSTILNITWNIYYGSINSSMNFTQWNLFQGMNLYTDQWFFGANTSNFTATKDLFLANPQFSLWRFEVVYLFALETSSSALNFVINQPPSGGSCSIDPQNGTTSTLFNISCPNWFDPDDIKDYSLYTWSPDAAERTLIAFSFVLAFQVQLPVGKEPTFSLTLVVYIRGTLGAITEQNLTSISVFADSSVVADLISDLQQSPDRLQYNPSIRSLLTGGQNRVGQVISSLSQQVNQINQENIDLAVSMGIPATSISVSPLGTQGSTISPPSFNTSALLEFNRQLNLHAQLREYLIDFISNLPITTSNTIQIQAKSLAFLTEATNQLTRTTLSKAADRCSRLAVALRSMILRLPIEEVQMGTTQLLQCSTNLLTAVNGPLQERTTVLTSDFSQATQLPADYETDLESEWSNPNLFAEGGDFSSATIDRGRNLFYQRRLADDLMAQTNGMITTLTNGLNRHLNVGQQFLVNTSSVFMSFERLSFESLLNKKQIQSLANVRLLLPSTLNISFDPTLNPALRSSVEPLASFGNSKSSLNTDLSTSISLTLVDHDGNELPLQTSIDHPFELWIPRDPQISLPSMDLQNVTSFGDYLFNLHFVNLQNFSSVSVHFELQPVRNNLSYLLIYRFDRSPIFNSSMRLIDGWRLLCASNLTNESLFTYFIDNEQTTGHQSVIYGVRELNSNETFISCTNASYPILPMIKERFSFTSNYYLRVFTSACFYLDANHQWQSDGMRVGSLSNHTHTQCFSTHLTRFTSGFTVLPAPVNWHYVFADLLENKAIYSTVIVVSIYFVSLFTSSHSKERCSSHSSAKWKPSV